MKCTAQLKLVSYAIFGVKSKEVVDAEEVVHHRVNINECIWW